MNKIDVDGSYSAEADKQDGTGLWVLVYSIDHETWDTFAGVFTSRELALEAAQHLREDDIEVVRVSLNVLMNGTEAKRGLPRTGEPFGWRE